MFLTDVSVLTTASQLGRLVENILGRRVEWKHMDIRMYVKSKGNLQTTAFMNLPTQGSKNAKYRIRAEIKQWKSWSS